MGIASILRDIKQCEKNQSKNESISRLFVTTWTVARQAPLSMGIFPARILEWGAMPATRGSSQARDRTLASYGLCIGRRVLYH